MFRGLHRKLLPWWLNQEEGERVGFSLEAVIDAVLEKLYQGLFARYPSHAPPSALPYIGRDRKIVRGINEPADSYRVRLLRWLDDHRVRGNPFALMDQLAAYCNADVRIRTVDRAGNWFTRERDGSRDFTLATGNWEWDTEPAAAWSRFWVIIYPTSAGQPWAINEPIGSGDLWGSGLVGGDPKTTIGTTATTDQVASVRNLVREWQPDGTRCEWIVIAFDDGSFDPTAPEPDGTWKTSHKIDGSNNSVPSRLATARYWRGVSRSV